MSMLTIIGYLVAVAGFVSAVYVVSEVGLAVMYARSYYRRHPELVAPDRFWVRIGLWGVR